ASRHTDRTRAPSNRWTAGLTDPGLSRSISTRCRGAPRPKKSDAHPLDRSLRARRRLLGRRERRARGEDPGGPVHDSRRPAARSGCRAEARRLLDPLRGDDPLRARDAARRFVRLRSLASAGLDRLLAMRERVKLKHALAVVAEEQGYASWLT